MWLDLVGESSTGAHHGQVASRSAPPPPHPPVESKRLCHNRGSFGSYPRTALSRPSLKPLDATAVLANAVQLAAPQGYMIPAAHTHARPYNNARAAGHCGGLPEDLTYRGGKLYNTRPAKARKVSSSKVSRSESRICRVCFASACKITRPQACSGLDQEVLWLKHPLRRYSSLGHF